MLYTVNLGLCDYVPFSQIRSHFTPQQQIHWWDVPFGVPMNVRPCLSFYLQSGWLSSSSISTFANAWTAIEEEICYLIDGLIPDGLFL